jgi:hypothetical protein
MEVGILLLFVSTVLAASAVWAFVQMVRQNDHDHTERLALAPIRDDVGHVQANGAES